MFLYSTLLSTLYVLEVRNQLRDMHGINELVDDIARLQMPNGLSIHAHSSRHIPSGKQEITVFFEKSHDLPQLTALVLGKLDSCLVQVLLQQLIDAMSRGQTFDLRHAAGGREDEPIKSTRFCPLRLTLTANAAFFIIVSKGRVTPPTTTWLCAYGTTHLSGPNEKGALSDGKLSTEGHSTISQVNHASCGSPVVLGC